MTPKLLNILLLTLSLVLYFYFVKPVYTGVNPGLWSPGEQNIQALIKKNADYDVAINTIDSVIKKAEELKRKYESFTEETKANIEIMVPTSIETLVMLDELTRVVEDTGPVDSIGIKDKGGGEYAVNLTVLLSYTQFKQFMTYWERNMRLYNIQSVSFSPGKREEDIIKFNVELATYYLKKAKQ